jgi:hypothetical protein
MAGLGRKVFTAGDVLTASDVQNYLMDQTVMNFAGTAARSSAIATPTDGMVTYNQSNDQLEAYNGSAWVGMSGLQLVKKQTIGTGVSTVNVTSAFSATYENYKIMVTGGVGSTAQGITLKMGATATGYYAVARLLQYGGVASDLTDNNAAIWNTTGESNTTTNQLNLDICQPFLSKWTSFQGIYTGTNNVGTLGGVLKNTTSYTDFTIGVAGTMTGGTIYVYGYGIS